MHYKYLQRNCSLGINTHVVEKNDKQKTYKHISQDNILFFLFVLFVCCFVQLLGCFYQSIFYSTYLRCDRWRHTSLSSSRANPSSRSAGSCTSPRRPQTKDRLLPLPHLKTCASKHPSPTRLSPPPRPSSTRMGEVTPTTGLTPGWAPPRSPRAASPATRCPARSSPAGTCLRCSGQRALSSPLSSWASNQGRMDRPSLEPLAPGFPISMTSRRRRCNPLLLRPPHPPHAGPLTRLCPGNICQTQISRSRHRSLHGSLSHWIKDVIRAEVHARGHQWQDWSRIQTKTLSVGVSVLSPLWATVFLLTRWENQHLCPQRRHGPCGLFAAILWPQNSAARNTSDSRWQTRDQ